MTLKIGYSDYTDAMTVVQLVTNYAQYPYNDFDYDGCTFTAFNLSSEQGGYPIYWAYYDADMFDDPEITESMIIK